MILVLRISFTIKQTEYIIFYKYAFFDELNDNFYMKKDYSSLFKLQRFMLHINFSCDLPSIKLDLLLLSNKLSQVVNVSNQAYYSIKYIHIFVSEWVSELKCLLNIITWTQIILELTLWCVIPSAAVYIWQLLLYHQLWRREDR